MSRSRKMFVLLAWESWLMETGNKRRASGLEEKVLTLVLHRLNFVMPMGNLSSDVQEGIWIKECEV